MNRKPIELHLVNGTTPEHDAIVLPESLRQRIPAAEWMDNPSAWNKALFVIETSDYLFDVYGIGSAQDKHTLTMLADQIDLYIQCGIGIEKNGIVTVFNDGKTIGPNPFITIRNNALKLIIQLMNELGLTPRSRLGKAGSLPSSTVNSLMLGPQVKR
jgi:phage terminase small subunit